jgi:hypothetical protein
MSRTRARRNYRLRRRRRIAWVKAYSELMAGVWSGMELVIEHPRFERHDRVRYVAQCYPIKFPA